MSAAVTTPPGSAHGPAEAPARLTDPAPRTLGLTDQLGLWANLGVSLLIPVTATFLLAPGQSFLATVTAIVVGTALGCLLLALVALAGAQTGAPGMVLLRGLLGRRLSALPTGLNLVQCVGWATFEVAIIAEAAARIYAGLPRAVYVVLAGTVATAMALRPLGSVRVLKRFALVAVVATTAYLLVEVGSRPLGSLTQGSWTGFWTTTDLVLALSASWVPLAADYSRFSRSGRAAFLGAGLGYAASSAIFFLLGVLALRAYALEPGFDVIDALLAVPVGALALLVLVVDEVDEAFANIYSTATSAQNLAPRLDRRLVAVGVGATAVVLALVVDVYDYEAFLFLIGAVFVPLAAVLVVDYFLLRRLLPSRGRWNVTDTAPARWPMLLPWVAGFAAYQLTTPTVIGVWPQWAQFWLSAKEGLGLGGVSGLSASLVSFGVAAVLAAVCGRVRTR